MIALSPLAPKNFPQMPKIKGVNLAAYPCNIKYKNRNDLLVVKLAKNTAVAGVFTKSTTCSANILWGKEHINKHAAKVLVVNAGNANAFNGSFGMETVKLIADKCALLFGCKKDEVFPCATGVIGQQMPNQKILDSIDQIANNWQEASWQEAADSIKTTDTFAKGAFVQTTINGKDINICGIAKGSGMIAPNMATMLAYVFTDANIKGEVLQQILTEANEVSFNSITVDSDTSTSDTLLMFATKEAANKEITDYNDPDLDSFKQALTNLLLDLAHLVVKDGEGATKFIQIDVIQAEHYAAAKNMAMSIANSPLVKTAITGEDANWGRIMMAIGKTGEKINIPKLSVIVGEIFIVKDGELSKNYDESLVTKHMQGQNINITVDLGVVKGSGKARVWTCNLTHAYIDINADYRS